MSEKYDILFEVVATGNFKRYFGKNYTAQQIDEISYVKIDILLERLKAIQPAEYAKSLLDTFCSLIAEVGFKTLQIKNVECVRSDLQTDPLTQKMVGYAASVIFSTFGFAFAPMTIVSVLAKPMLREKYDDEALTIEPQAEKAT